VPSRWDLDATSWRALSGRFHDAKNDAYDLRGASLLIAADVRLPALVHARRISGQLRRLSAGRLSRQLYASAQTPAQLRQRFIPPPAAISEARLFLRILDRTAQPALRYTDHRLLAN